MNRKLISTTYGTLIVRVIEFYDDTNFKGELLYVEKPNEMAFIGKILSGLNTKYWEECPPSIKIEIPLTL